MSSYFYQVYLRHANAVVTDHVTKGTRHMISRAKIEEHILGEIEKSNLPRKYRFAWYALILQSDTFDIYWLGQRAQHHLSKESIVRLTPDMKLVESIVFESPQSSPGASDRFMTPEPEGTGDAEPGEDQVEGEYDQEDNGTEAFVSSETQAAEYDQAGDEEENGRASGSPSAAVVPGTARKTTPGGNAQNQPAAKTPRRRRSTASSRSRSRKKGQVASKQPRSRPVKETNASDVSDEQLQKRQERGRRAWATRRRKAAEAAAAAEASAAALAAEQGNDGGDDRMQISPRLPNDEQTGAVMEATGDPATVPGEAAVDSPTSSVNIDTASAPDMGSFGIQTMTPPAAVDERQSRRKSVHFDLPSDHNEQ